MICLARVATVSRIIRQYACSLSGCVLWVRMHAHIVQAAPECSRQLKQHRVIRGGQLEHLLQCPIL